MARVKAYIGLGVCTILLLGLAVYGRDREVQTSVIIISEVCAANETTAHDENGDYGADYIELYNISNETIDLTGYGISDDESDFYKFALPEIQIAPDTGIVLWCDDVNEDLSTYADNYIVQNIHGVNIGISRSGERLYLTDPQGGVVYSVAVPGNVADGLSYQVTKEDLTAYTIGTATLHALADNMDEIAPITYDLEEPVFSVDGGWYDDAVMVELTCAEGEIYYTVDGSEPDEMSMRYDGPIVVTNRSAEPNTYSSIDDISLNNPYVPNDPVDKATAIKAVAIDDGRRSEVAARTYFVGLGGDSAYQNMSVLSLTVDPEDLFGHENGIYVAGVGYDQYRAKYGIEDPQENSSIYTYANYAKEGIGWERPAQIEFYTEDHQEVLRQEIGIRIHGGWSTSYNQKGFNLYAREQYDGNDVFQYDFLGKRTGRLMLRAGGYRDVYATKIRDVLNQQLVRDRAVDCQDALPCIVFINGEFWGLYNLQEKVGTAYIEANYGIDEEDVIVLKNPFGQETEEIRSYSDIIAYAEEHDLSVDENYAWVTDRIDIDSYIDYYCFQIYIGNCDSVYNNYAVWRSREIRDDAYQDGKWRFMLYDTDDSAGMVDGYSEVDTDHFVGGHWTRDPLGENGDTLFTALMENASFKEQFVTTFMDMANENFDYDRVHEMLVDLAIEYCNADVASQTRFRGDYAISMYSGETDQVGEYTTTDYWRDVQVIDDYYKERKGHIAFYMKEDLDLKGELASLYVGSNVDGDATIGVNTLTMAAMTTPWEGEYYTDYPVHLTCTPDEGYTFTCWMVNGEVVSDEPVLELQLADDTSVVAIVDQE